MILTDFMIPLFRTVFLCPSLGRGFTGGLSVRPSQAECYCPLSSRRSIPECPLASHMSHICSNCPRWYLLSTHWKSSLKNKGNALRINSGVLPVDQTKMLVL